MLHKIQILFILFSTSIILFSCNEEVEIESTQNSTEKKEPVESIAKRYVESKLEISAAEKYNLAIYKSQLDGDNF